VKYWKIIADKVSKAVNLRDFGQPWIPTGETIWIADAHRGDGKRLVVHADERLTAFLELESAIRGRGVFFLTSWRRFLQTRRR
jgi:hypothetical protein